MSLLPVGAGAQAAATQLPAAAQIVALVEQSPQLRIDQTIFSSGFDAQTHPFVDVRNAPEGTIGGYLVPEGAHQGTLDDGTEVLAVPLDSGGSGGVFTQVIFARKGGAAFAYAGFIDSGGHLAVGVENGTIVAAMPYYGDDSPNCCPKQQIVRTFTIRGGALVKLSEKRSDIPKSE